MVGSASASVVCVCVYVSILTGRAGLLLEQKYYTWIGPPQTLGR